jgi:hypothetical protein
VVAGNITTQPKQGRWVVPMSSLSILLCLWFNANAWSSISVKDDVEQYENWFIIVHRDCGIHTEIKYRHYFIAKTAD